MNRRGGSSSNCIREERIFGNEKVESNRGALTFPFSPLFSTDDDAASSEN